jgi:hypothetical protein
VKYFKDHRLLLLQHFPGLSYKWFAVAVTPTPSSPLNISGDKVTVSTSF